MANKANMEDRSNVFVDLFVNIDECEYCCKKIKLTQRSTHQMSETAPCARATQAMVTK